MTLGVFAGLRPSLKRQSVEVSIHASYIARKTFSQLFTGPIQPSRELFASIWVSCGILDGTSVSDFDRLARRR